MGQTFAGGGAMRTEIHLPGRIEEFEPGLWLSMEGPLPPPRFVVKQSGRNEYGVPSYETVREIRTPNDGCSNSPDSVAGISIAPACVIHDYCYREWYRTKFAGTAKRRKFADDCFRRNVRRCLDMGGFDKVSAREMLGSFGKLLQFVDNWIPGSWLDRKLFTPPVVSWLYWGRVRIWGRDGFGFGEGQKPRSRLRLFKEVYWSLVRDVIRPQDRLLNAWDFIKAKLPW